MATLIIKRLLWMIPTLIAISIISFTVIQLPPGDYLTAYITTLEQTGETVDASEIARLRAQYALDEPIYIQYFTWMGGLLTGDMGRSFEWGDPVVDLIGERLLLTMILSITTLLFTWVVAVPIGIYSAIRQYHLSDYLFTLFGFIGLATPNFLLALIFLYVTKQLYPDSTIGGLFSEQYQNAGWSLGKVGDMFLNLWVPVVVIGTAGTAGLIRVMRGNLLDELNKAYVTTARAKGLAGWKVVLKYPVRVAINPMISTIGWILPEIVSGAAIVSIVLGLPTTGPLLLNALLTQDMYLAGSMIMMLAVLTVIGTLVSDLLLLWLDPRIRYEQKS